jgi:hypothetical protein
MKDEHARFLGTYFDKDTVLKLARASKTLAWIVLGVYGIQLIASLLTNIIQIRNGFWVGLGLTDAIQNFLYAIEQPLHGIVYFFALLGISQLLLIFLDIEDNTRRAARAGKIEN